MSKAQEFDKWYKENEARFHSGQFSCRQEVHSAWGEANRLTLKAVDLAINELEISDGYIKADELKAKLKTQKI